MTDLSSFEVTGTNNASKQVSVTFWNAFIAALETAIDGATPSGAQPLDSDLTAIAALATTSFGRSLLTLADAAALAAAHDHDADYAALGHDHDADYQPLDTDLTAIAGLTSAADKGIQFTGAGTAATYDLTAAGKALLDDASAAAQRTTLGLGTSATMAEEWAPNFTADGNLYIPAVEAMTISQGNAAIGTGTLAFEKSTNAAPGTFNSTTLPATLEAGAWLKVAATSVTGFVATHLRRTA